VTSGLRQHGRAWDDTEDAIQDATADRDAADDDLDLAAQEGRATLAGRSVTTVKESPYTDIFPQGVGYYTAAPLDEEVKRYTELKKRVSEHLPAGDAVRVQVVQAVDTHLPSFETGGKALDAARTEEAMAATRLAKATDAWTKQMEKTYGALVADVGRAAAERFFPRVTRKVPKPKGGAPG
jgi:hypothetical protein